MISQHVEAMEQYSDSAEDQETVCCFFDFHEIKASPRSTRKLVIDLLVSEHLAQSTSHNALTLKSEEDGKKIP